MKLNSIFVVSLTALAVSACAPRDTVHYYSIDEALKSPEAQEVLNPDIKLYFGKPAPGKVVDAGAVSNRKTNNLNKSDEKGCRWAFLSAVKKFQERAASQDARKVGNIISFYKKVPYSSTTQYECHAGRSIAGVALKGDIVR